MYFLRYII